MPPKTKKPSDLAEYCGDWNDVVLMKFMDTGKNICFRCAEFGFAHCEGKKDGCECLGCAAAIKASKEKK